MNTKIINIAMFTVGAALGSGVTWKLISKKYEQKVQEEIDSVKEAFASKKSVVYNMTDKERVDHIREVGTVENKAKCAAIVNSQGYTNYSDYSKSDADEDEDGDEPIYADHDGDKDEPYVISPEEFGDIDGYEKVSLTYYADEILADELDGLVERVDMIVGSEALESFGQYEDDSVFVRNDRLKCDYEILKDLRRWEDIVNPPKPKTRKATQKKPHQMED